MRPFNLLHLLNTLRTHGIRIIPWVALFTLGGYGIAYVIPPTYRAQATILAPEEDEMATSLQMARRNIAGIGGLARLSSYFTQGDMALAILRSRSMAESVIRRFDLQDRYRTRRLDDAVRRLRDCTDVRMATDGTISASIEDGNATRAAEMANFLFAELDRFNQEKRSFRARRSRMFLENRVAETDSVLRDAEQRLVAYQRARGSIVLSPESRGGLESVAQLMGQKAQAEVELEMARRFASPGSEEIARLEARLRELRRQIGAAPATQAGGASALREVLIQQQLLTLLSGQLEEARLREVMDTPTIQVLDSARPPDRPVWPRKLWIAGFGAIIGFVVALTDLGRIHRRSAPAGA